MRQKLTLVTLAAIALAMAHRGSIQTKTGEKLTGDIVFYTTDSIVLVDSLQRRVTLPSSSVSFVQWAGEVLEPELPSLAYADFAPVYLVREKNPGEAALYALVGLPTVVPLGQLYNGEMGKAGFVSVVKLIAMAATAAGYAMMKGNPRQDDNAGTALMVIGGIAFAGTSVYTVIDAAVSADRINQEIRFGLKARL